jgi:hypothetical protein
MFKRSINQMSTYMLLPTQIFHKVYVDANKKLILIGLIERYENKIPFKS